MRTKMIESYIEKLSASLGGIRPLIPPEKLRELHEKKDFTGMVGYIRTTLNLGLRIRVGFVNSGGPTKAPAWIVIPNPIPPYGTRKFNETRVTIHLRKLFLKKSTLETKVTVIAHELSHVVLASIHHELKNREEAVDLTAMILGYRDFFRIGCQQKIKITESTLSNQNQWYPQIIIDRILDYVLGKKIIIATDVFGYLTPEEVEFAANIMDRYAKH